jgi:hypothetical protein
MVFVSLFAGVRPVAAQDPGPSRALVDQASGLARNLLSTGYRHENDTKQGNSSAASVRKKDGKFIIETDCSGWVSYNLQQRELESPWYKAIQAYQSSMPTEKGAKYPRANVYQAYFASLSESQPFVRVPTLAEVRPGDILAWCLGSHCKNPTSPTKAKDTGHVMIVLSEPLQLDDSHHAFLLVLDSSSVAHWSFEDLPQEVKGVYRDVGLLYRGFPQVREQPMKGNPPKPTGGVGAGFILFGTDAHGAISSFQFDKGDKVKTTHEGIQFSVGRLVAPANSTH